MLAIDDGAMPARAARAARPIPALLVAPRLVRTRPAGSRNHVPIPVASEQRGVDEEHPRRPEPLDGRARRRTRRRRTPRSPTPATARTARAARPCGPPGCRPSGRARRSSPRAAPSETASVSTSADTARSRMAPVGQRRRDENRPADVAGLIGDRAPRRRREQPDDREPADEQADHLQVEAARPEVQRDVRQVRARGCRTGARGRSPAGGRIQRPAMARAGLSARSCSTACRRCWPRCRWRSCCR